jgi:hypothetical protein
LIDRRHESGVVEAIPKLHEAAEPTLPPAALWVRIQRIMSRTSLVFHVQK